MYGKHVGRIKCMFMRKHLFLTDTQVAIESRVNHGKHHRIESGDGPHEPPMYCARMELQISPSVRNIVAVSIWTIEFE